VKQLVRSCEKTYDEELLERAGIKVDELVFPDGQLPEQSTIDAWLKIVDEFFASVVPVISDKASVPLEKSARGKRNSKSMETGSG
jgi:hypothetical protein